VELRRRERAIVVPASNEVRAEIRDGRERDARPDRELLDRAERPGIRVAALRERFVEVGGGELLQLLPLGGEVDGRARAAARGAELAARVLRPGRRAARPAEGLEAARPLRVGGG